LLDNCLELNLDCCPFRHLQVTSLHKVTAIQGGEAHTLVLTKDSKVLSFGAGTYGMLGR
jgi:alpha-tubulin suppressor-like RCC1 family protein